MLYSRRIVFYKKQEEQDNQSGSNNQDTNQQQCDCGDSNIESANQEQEPTDSREITENPSDNTEVGCESTDVSGVSDKSCENDNNTDNKQVSEIGLTSTIEDIEKFKSLLKELEWKGGGEQVEITKSKINHEFKTIMERLGSGMSFKQQKGNTHINTELFMTNLVSRNYEELKRSTFDYKPKLTYFFVDTSGSVSEFAEVFIEMINSCTQSKFIKVISGTEAKAERDESLKVNIEIDNSKWDKEEDMCHFGFLLQNFIKQYKVPLQSTFVFWGDGYGADIDISLKSILMNYKAIWLSPNDKDEYRNSNYNTLISVEQMIPTYYNMNSIKTISKQLKRLI